MKFLTFKTNSSNAENLGVQLDDGQIFNVSEAAKEKSLNVPTSMISLILAGDEGVAAIRDFMNARIGEEHLYQQAKIVYLPPIKTGKNVFCVGRNYKEHIIEGNRANGRPEHQFPEAIEFFTKPPTALIGHRANVLRHQAITKSLDYEVELAIVIGKGGKDIREEDALSHVFGYTVVNDITARDLQKRHGQWFKGKGLDTTCPIGPVITHHSAISNPNNLTVMLEVNGETRQRHNTNDMIFSVERIIAELSIGMTLEPGDVISTGTPQGVGFAMTPPRCLDVGDVVRAHVEGVGALDNTVIS
jgi:2-keto-4-pentenoate hydratase/2-oxohepta-3-ene-1,7-dioic acid hydratase in catechol pathway